MPVSIQEAEMFLGELAMSMPSELRRQAREAFRQSGFIADLAKEVRSDQIRKGVGTKLGRRFLSVPTWFEIAQAVRQEIGAESRDGSRSSETDTWINYLRDRYSLLPDGPARDNAKSLFMRYAPVEAKAMAFSAVPEAFPRDQDDRDHEQFWWDRLDRIFALPWIDNQVGEAKGLLERIERGTIKTAPIFVASRLRDFLAEHEDIEGAPLPRLAGLGRVKTDDEASPQPPMPVYPKPHEVAPAPRGPSKASALAMGEVRGSRAKSAPMVLPPEVLAARQAREALLAHERKAAREKLMAIPVPRMPG
jgi:hypothetical protein